MEKTFVVSEGKKLYASMGEKPCPLGCIYCFVDAVGYQPVGRVDTKDGLTKLGFEVEREDGLDILLPTHDVEMFLVRNWAETLLRLTNYGRCILFSTKLALRKGMPPHGDARIAHLARVDALLKQQGTLLLVAPSITRLYDWQEIERFTASPKERMDVVRHLHAAGLSTNISIRPTLPFVPMEEFEELIAETSPYCASYQTTRLYLTPAMKAYMNRNYPGYSTTPFHLSCMRSGIEAESVDTTQTQARVREIAARYGRPCFPTSRPVIAYALSLHHDQRFKGESHGE